MPTRPPCGTGFASCGEATQSGSALAASHCGRTRLHENQAIRPGPSSSKSSEICRGGYESGSLRYILRVRFPFPCKSAHPPSKSAGEAEGRFPAWRRALRIEGVASALRNCPEATGWRFEGRLYGEDEFRFPVRTDREDKSRCQFDVEELPQHRPPQPLLTKPASGDDSLRHAGVGSARERSDGVDGRQFRKLVRPG